MANGNLKIWIGIVITLLVLAGGIVANYTLQGAKADANAKDIGEIEDEQDLQWTNIRANNDRGIRVEVQMTNIQKDVTLILEKVEKLHE